MDLKRKQLTLNRETLRELTEGDLEKIAGGTPTQAEPVTVQLVDACGDPDEFGIYNRRCIR